MASAQKDEGSFDLIIMGLAMSKRVRFRRSAVPFDDEEYDGVVSCWIPLFLRKVEIVLVRDPPVYSFLPSM